MFHRPPFVPKFLHSVHSMLQPRSTRSELGTNPTLALIPVSVLHNSGLCPARITHGNSVGILFQVSLIYSEEALLTLSLHHAGGRACLGGLSREIGGLGQPWGASLSPPKFIVFQGIIKGIGLQALVQIVYQILDKTRNMVL